MPGFNLHLYSNQRSREHREWKRILPLNHVEQLAKSLNEFIDLGQLIVIFGPVRFPTAMKSVLERSDPDRGWVVSKLGRIRGSGMRMEGVWKCQLVSLTARFERRGDPSCCK